MASALLMEWELYQMKHMRLVLYIVTSYPLMNLIYHILVKLIAFLVTVIEEKLHTW